MKTGASVYSAPVAQALVGEAMVGEDTPARALFTLGVPRSGTTVVGRYVASGDLALDMGEYAGFYIANGVAPPIMLTYPSSLKYLYMTDLQQHAKHFAEDAAAAAGCTWYADDTPWNLRCITDLTLQLPDAIFVLMLRHYRGAINSLRRLYSKKSPWAGANIYESAQVWRNMVADMAKMPWERTVVVGYDKLCRDPVPTLAKLRADLTALGFDAGGFKDTSLCSSYANPKEKRRTLGTRRDDGTVEIAPITSLDEERWTEQMEKAVWPIVREGHEWLLRRFPDDYLPEPVTASSLAHGRPARKKPAPAARKPAAPAKKAAAKPRARPAPKKG